MIPDHCRAYALSYPQDNDYIKRCDHEHNARCDRCEILATVFHEIQEVLGSVDCDEEQEEMEYQISEARQNIQAWKAHLLRSINQDAARHEILENLDAKSIFPTMDWAMKFLPRKFRESQSDWFGKRGIPWHVSVAMRNNGNNETEMLTFVHTFESCTQDSSAVLAIIDDVFSQLKGIMPEINCVYLRQDNAGCYHCASTLLLVHRVASKHGINLRRVDFSDPQSGKGACDRKAATLKSHMRIYVNAGHDIETASQMMTAIESSGGTAGVSVTVSGPQPTEKSAPVKWEGVSFINNIEYSSDGMQVWRAYGIGCGKFLPWSNFRQASSSLLPRLNKLADNASSDVSFETVKARQRPKLTTELASAIEKDSDEENSENRSGLFYCPEEGCVKSFQQYSSLEKHLDCDTHKYALEHETLYDKAMIMYAAKLEHGAGVVPETVDEDVIISDSLEDEGPALSMGWALKSATVTRKNFTATQKTYLTEVFQEGERTGQKADPSEISKAMRRAKHSDGSSIFEKDDFLTPLQIAGFFSRLTAKKNYCTSVEDDERHEASKEKDIQELTEEVMKTFALQHPIMFGKYNICEIVCQSKLSKFSVGMLHEICTALELDVSSITSKRKKPYMDLLQRLVDTCSCKTMN